MARFRSRRLITRRRGKGRGKTGNSSLNGANNNPQTQQVNNPAQAQQDRLIEEGSEVDSEVEEGKGDDDDENDEKK